MKFLKLLTIISIVYLSNGIYNKSQAKNNFIISEGNKTEISKRAIKNSSFENRFTGNWVVEKQKGTDAVCMIKKKLGKNGSNALQINSTEKNDVRLKQTIVLEKDKIYRLKAMVKTEGVKDGYGANICVNGTWSRSEPVKGDSDWKKVSLTFSTPYDNDSITIACRLGYWNGTSSGTAYFDNVEVEEVQLYEAQGEHFRLRLDEEDVDGIPQKTIDNWLDNLDKSYEKYYELIGEKPWNGRMITIFSVEQKTRWWAIAGNPIQWNKKFVKNVLKDVNSGKDWCFGILHEIGHDFSPHVGMKRNGKWNWNEEMFANFRMYYVVDQLNAPIKMNGKFYNGNGLKAMYKTDSRTSYDNGIGKGLTKGHDGIMYTLIRIQEQIGWEPFKKTYRFLYKSDVNPESRWDKFTLFLDKLTEYSNVDVRKTYSEKEWEVIKKMLTKS